jgi:lysozyme family protein
VSAENFEACFAVTESWEGWHKFSDDPRDPGGATWCGLTQGVYEAWRKSKGLGASPVREATDEEVKEIFRVQYWTPVKGDDLWAGLDMLMFDRAINEGVVRPTRDLQRIVGATPDGQLGLETLHAIQVRSDKSVILSRLHAARLGYWMSLTGLWRVFGRGWSARETSVYLTAQRMMFADVTKAKESVR